jgi:hypothetical protein
MIGDVSLFTGLISLGAVLFWKIQALKNELKNEKELRKQYVRHFSKHMETQMRTNAIFFKGTTEEEK